MPPLNFYDRQHLQRMFVQERQVNTLFSQLIAAIAPEMRKWHDTGNKNSVWVRNGSVENKINLRLLEFNKTLYNLIQNNQSVAWKSATEKNDKIVEQYIKGMAISSVSKEGMFSRNLDGLKALQRRVDNGMNLSDRVWNITNQTKGHVELFLESGMATGRSAEAIGRDMRQMLNNPDKRFRRIRDENGKLVLSQPMKDYHPGKGVYRSSRMNALRVSATETNMGYRGSDSGRWQQLDFVLGFEVKRSPNAHPCAICDAMKGKYPKDFVFLGWHPFCICFAVPIVMEHDDFADFLLDDDIPENKIITDIPKDAREWTNQYMNKSGKSPLFVKNNESFFSKKDVVSEKNDFSKISDSNNTTTSKTAAIRIPRTQEQRAAIQKRWDERKLYNDVRKTEDEIRMNKDFETAVIFDKKGNVILDKRGEKYSVGFTAEETAKMKDAIITHNHPRGWSSPEKSLGRIGNSFSIEDINLAVKSDAAEMRAVTPNFTFVMKRPEKGWGLDNDKINSTIKKENNALKKEMWKGIDDGTITPERASAVHYHILWKRVSKKLKWEYSKSKTR